VTCTPKVGNQLTSKNCTITLLSQPSLSSQPFLSDLLSYSKLLEPPLNSTEVSEAGSRESILIGWDLYWSLVALFIALWGLFYLIWKATRQRRLNTDL